MMPMLSVRGCKFSPRPKLEQPTAGRSPDSSSSEDERAVFRARLFLRDAALLVALAVGWAGCFYGALCWGCAP